MHKKEIKFEQPSFLLLFFNKYTSFIIIAIVILILISGYLFLFVPKISAIKEIREGNTASEDKQTENRAILEDIARLNVLYKNIKEERAEVLSGLTKLIPEEPQIAELFVMMEKIALDNDFILNNITVTGEDNNTDEVKKANINISVTHLVKEEDGDDIDFPGEDGALSIEDNLYTEEEEIKSSYEAFKLFLVALESNLRLMDINTVTFGSLPVGEDGGAVGSTGFTFTLTTYFR